MHCTMSSTKWRPFCLGLIVFNANKVSLVLRSILYLPVYSFPLLPTCASNSPETTNTNNWIIFITHHMQMIIMNCVNFLLWVDGMVMWYRDVYYWITDRHWIKQKQMFLGITCITYVTRIVRRCMQFCEEYVPTIGYLPIMSLYPSSKHR